MILKFRHYALLALITFLLALAGRMSLPPLDRDESRYMEATQQMVLSKNYIDIRFQDQPRYLQPAGIYWLEAASLKIAQKIITSDLYHQAWVYRIPSLIAASFIIPITAWIGTVLFSDSVGLLAALFLMASTVFVAESHMATIDTVLLLIIVSSEAIIIKAYLAVKNTCTLPLPSVFAFWGLVGIGLMLKGPIPLIPIFGTIFCLSFLEKTWKILSILRSSWGWLLSLLMITPWYLAITHISHGDFFSHAVSHNLLGKITHGQESHGFLPGYYLIIFIVSFWPASLFSINAIPHIFTHRQETSVRFLLSWLLPHWIFFELLATKLPHYVLPTYPAIAILTAAFLLLWSQENISSLWRRIIATYSFIWVIFTLILISAGIILLIKYEHLISIRVVIAFIASFILLLYGIYFFKNNEKLASSYCMIGMSLLTQMSIFLAVIPHLHLIMLSPHIAEKFQHIKTCPQSHLISTAYSEPSLVFLTRADTSLISSLPLAANNLLQNTNCNILLAKTASLPELYNILKEKGFTLSPLAKIEGLNYSTGHHLEMTFLRALPLR